MSKSGLFRHFGSKEELQLATVARRRSASSTRWCARRSTRRRGCRACGHSPTATSATSSSRCSPAAASGGRPCPNSTTARARCATRSASASAPGPARSRTRRELAGVDDPDQFAFELVSLARERTCATACSARRRRSSAPARACRACSTTSRMKIAGIHHFDLVVSSLDRSLPLYREMLEPLGYTGTSEITGEQGERVVYLNGPGKVSFSLREAKVSGDYDRYRIGIHHVAFAADSRELVDDRFDWAKRRRPRDRKRAAQLRLRARVLRGLLLRPRRHQARDRPRA